MKRLKKRADFLKVAKGKAVRMPGFVLQFIDTQDDEAQVGFTVTKRQGKAVVRNRIRRRLREAVRLADKTTKFSPGAYVLIGRSDSLALSFGDLQDNIVRAFQKIGSHKISERQ